jgi:putative Ca2+/H+ antiporter (TMEM165/GDT1 family)
VSLETLLPPPDLDPADSLDSLPAFNDETDQLEAQDKGLTHQPLPEFRGYFWGVFGSTFITIFLAELGDKTQVTTLLMSAESQQPWVVFVGAATALVATSLMGVLLGQWLAKRISPQLLDTLAGVILLLITIGLVADVLGV